MTRPSLLTLAWIVHGLFAVAVLAWLPFSAIAVDVDAVTTIVTGVLQLGGVALLIGFLARRLDGDSNPIAGKIRFAANGVQLFAIAGIYLLIFTSFAVVLNYLGMATAMPLQDETFAAIDRAMGFDWTAMLGWMNNHPALGNALTFAYNTSFVQTIAVLMVLSMMCQSRNLQEFITLYAVTSFVTILISASVPALGAYVYHAPDAALFDNLNPEAGRWHLVHLEALRAGTFSALDFSKAEGLVTFPSFHTILAIITAYALRETRFIAIPVFLLNVAVIASTLTEGGHYLIDVMAGAAVAGASIWLVRRLPATRIPDANVTAGALLQAGQSIAARAARNAA